jgi:hypothetical protein
MRQRDHIAGELAESNARCRPDLFLQRAHRQKLCDRQASDRDDQLGLQQRDLALQPRPAVLDLGRRRHAIAALRQLAGEATADRGHVDALAKRRFVEAQSAEPAKQLLAGRPCERPAQRRFLGARRLPDQQHAREYGLAEHHGLVHLRAARAAPHRRLMRT